MSEGLWSPGFDVTVPKLDRILERGVALFFRHMYPIYPLLDQRRITALLSRSLCALSLVTVGFWPTMTAERRIVVACEYIRQCLEARVTNDITEHATMDDVLTSLFIAVAYFDLKCRKTSWFYLREAISLAQLAGIATTVSDPELDAPERARR
jgi:hypothetical protein